MGLEWLLFLMRTLLVGYKTSDYNKIHVEDEPYLVYFLLFTTLNYSDSQNLKFVCDTNVPEKPEIPRSIEANIDLFWIIKAQQK